MEKQVAGNDTWIHKSKEFYTDNFPSDDQTFIVILTIISMVLSGLNFITLSADIRYYDIFLGFGVIFVFTVVICGINYFFYRGLLLDDHRQFVLWFVLKLVEIIGSVRNVILIYVSHGSMYIYHLNYIIPFSVFIALNILMVLYMLLKVKQMKKKSRKQIYLLSTHIEPLTSKEKEEKKTQDTQLLV